MIIVPCEQGSPSWIAARIGLPTASQMHRILTPKTRKLSDSSINYIAELLAEQMMDASLDPFVNEWMERGKELEDSAVKFYEMDRDVDTQKVGFILHDNGLYGCSPDRLVGDEGGLEIKCPSPTVHVLNMLGMAEKYVTQCQASMLITGRPWWDLLSYHPDLEPALVRVKRDEEHIAQLEKALGLFCKRLHAARYQLGLAELTPATVAAPVAASGE